MILALGAIVTSCEKDDDFTQVSAFESQLHNELNNYRKGKGLSELVLQFVMVKEAQEHAVGWANGSINQDNYIADIEQRWHNVEGKLGVANISNERTILTQITTQTAAEVVAEWAVDSTFASWMEEDLTQSGPGTGTTSDGRTYIVHMLCKWEEK